MIIKKAIMLFYIEVKLEKKIENNKTCVHGNEKFYIWLRFQSIDLNIENVFVFCGSEQKYSHKNYDSTND